jgi:hypothetical protein
MSLVESYVKESNPLLVEIERLKSRLAILEQKFNNEISKRRGPKTKHKNGDTEVDNAPEIKDVIFIEKESPDDKNELIVIHKNGNDKSAPIIELSNTQLDNLISAITAAEVGDSVIIADYKVLNKIAQKDELGDWLLPVS